MTRTLRSMLSFAATLAAAVSLAGTPAAAEPAEYAFDKAHSQILLSWDHLGFSTFTAQFTDFSGTLMLDEDSPENSSLEVTIPIESLDTGVADLDEELVGDDYFDADAHPTAVFESEQVEMTGEKTAKVYGTLTIKGESRPFTLDVTLNKLGEHPLSGKKAAGFSATGTLKRSDYGIDKYVPVVSDEIDLSISAEAALAE